jgi:hypothetical protein
MTIMMNSPETVKQGSEMMEEFCVCGTDKKVLIISDLCGKLINTMNAEMFMCV